MVFPCIMKLPYLDKPVTFQDDGCSSFEHIARFNTILPCDIKCLAFLSYGALRLVLNGVAWYSLWVFLDVKWTIPAKKTLDTPQPWSKKHDWSRCRFTWGSAVVSKAVHVFYGTMQTCLLFCLLSWPPSLSLHTFHFSGAELIKATIFPYLLLSFFRQQRKFGFI